MKIQKRVTAFITALTMIASAAGAHCSVFAAETQNEVIYGDLNSDKNVDVTDLSVLSLYLIGDRELENDMQKEAADVQYDGVIDLGDLAALRQYLSKKISAIGKLNDITDQCRTVTADTLGIFEGFEYNSGEFGAYSGVYMIRTMADFNKYIAFSNEGSEAFVKSGIEINDEFFDNNCIALEINTWEANGVEMKLSSVKTDGKGNVHLYFERTVPGDVTELARFKYNIVIIPGNADAESECYTHYNDVSRIYDITDPERTVNFSTDSFEGKGDYPESYGMISSMDELNELSSKGIDTSEIIRKLEIDEAYFNRNALLYYTVSEKSDGAEYSISSVTHDNKGNVTMEISHAVPADHKAETKMKYWLLGTTVVKRNYSIYGDLNKDIKVNIAEKPLSEDEKKEFRDINGRYRCYELRRSATDLNKPLIITTPDDYTAFADSLDPDDRKAFERNEEWESVNFGMDSEYFKKYYIVVWNEKAVMNDTIAGTYIDSVRKNQYGDIKLSYKSLEPDTENSDISEASHTFINVIEGRSEKDANVEIQTDRIVSAETEVLDDSELPEITMNRKGARRGYDSREYLYLNVVNNTKGFASLYYKFEVLKDGKSYKYASNCTHYDWDKTQLEVPCLCSDYYSFVSDDLMNVYGDFKTHGIEFDIPDDAETGDYIMRVELISGMRYNEEDGKYYTVPINKTFTGNLTIV